MTPATLIDRGNCPLCGGAEHRTHMAFADIPVVRCTRCGFLFSSHIQSTDDLEQGYADASSSERHRQGQQVNALCNAWAIDHLLRGTKVDSLLDVGAGYGYLMAEVQRRRNIPVTGVELSRVEAGHGRHELGLEMVEDSLSGADLRGRQFSLVTAFEVIEHIPEPRDFLVELAERVQPGGHLLIATDNFEGRAARALGAGLPKWIPYSHVSHFAPDTLRKAVTSTPGLEMVRFLSYTPWELRLRMVRQKQGASRTPAEAQSGFSSATGGDSRETFRLFALRKRLNPLWLRMTAADEDNGDLMYCLARKTLS